MPTITCPHRSGPVDLYYESSGAGRPPIVFVHGFACAHEDWRHQMAGLGARHRVVSLDLAGHGGSTLPSGALRVERLGDDVVCLLEALDLRAACLVGHSMGCRVVMQARRSAPDRVGGLVLVDGSWIGRGDPAALERDARAAFEQAGFDSMVRTLFEQMFLPGTESDDRAGIVSRALDLDPEAGVSLFGSLVGWDARHAEECVRAGMAPTLVIQSTYLNEQRERVALSPGESTPWLDLTRAAGARVEIVPGVGHFPMLEAPERVNGLIEDFLGSPAEGE